MKLRQKLAVVMAAAMVVTAVPVITTAATTNSLSMSSISMVKDGKIGFTVVENKNENGVTTSSTYEVVSAPLTLNIATKADETNINQSFFVKIENAKFQSAAYYAANAGSAITVDNKGYLVSDATVSTANAVYTTEKTDANGDVLYTMKVTVASATELKVDVQGSLKAGDTLNIPVLAVAGSGEVSLKIDGTDTFVTSGTTVIGTTSAKGATVEATSAKVSEEGGVVGNIIISEATKGILATSEDKVIEINLPTSEEFEFGTTAGIKLDGGKGFAGLDFTGFNAEVSEDGQTLTIDLSGVKTLANQTAVGQVVIKGIEVVPTGKKAAKGEVRVTVKNSNLETTTVTVAEVVDEDAVLACSEAIEIVGGKKAGSVKFTLTENTKEAIYDGRKAEFTLENGFIAVRSEKPNRAGEYHSALETFKNLVTSGDIELPSQVSVNDIVAAEANAEGQITGFTVQFNSLTPNTASELEFKMPIMADITTTGEVKLAVDGRAIQTAQEATIATVKAPFEVTAETVELKVGLNGQVGGKLTITETDAKMLEKGTVKITMDEYKGITFKKGQELDIQAENLKIKNVKVYSDAIEFDVDRTSEEAGNIVINGIEFNVDRTAPEGSFDLTIEGTAISTNTYLKSGLETLTVSEFVTIGTKNTEDIAGTGSNGLKTGTAKFTIGNAKYTLNGVEKDMDAAPYLVNNRTMVPVRYVSEAFGIDGDNVTFNKGVVTLFAGNRIVQLTNGSNKALVNGVEFTMDQAVVIKDGRTYIPVGEVARLIGVKVTWDNETKTATFAN